MTLNPSNLTIATLFLLLWIFPSILHADTSIPVYITSNGLVYLSCPSLSDDITQEYMYKGVYPDTELVVEQNVSITVSCNGLENAFSLEDGWLNQSQATNTEDGTYFVRFKLNQQETPEYYFTAIRSGGIWGCVINCSGTTTTPVPTIPIVKNIEILNPTYGTTTATTTYQVVVKYKTPFSIDFRATTTRHFEIVDAVTGELNFSYNVTIPANSSENLQIATTATTSIGSKYIRAMYLDINGAIYSEVDEVFFNVATNTYFMATGLVSPRDNGNTLTQIDCGTFEFGCQVQKAIAFLFYPSPDILDRFTNLWQTIAEKKPFGYVSMTIRQLEELNTSGTTAFSLGTVPFMDSIFTPFKVLVGSILWALYAIYFYKKRLIHLDI